MEFDAGLPRADAEAIARREKAAGIYDCTQAEHDASPNASAQAELRAKCLAYIPEDRWHQAIADATTFITKWGAKAQAFGWTARELLACIRCRSDQRPIIRDCRASMTWGFSGSCEVAR